MARFKVNTSNIEEMFAKLADSADGTAKKALYAGSAIMADSIKDSMKGIQTKEREEYVKGEKLILNAAQKQELIDGFGIAPFRFNASKIDTHLGFDGYSESTAWNQSSNGKLPLPVLARSVESGTSFRRAQPFMSKAVKAAKEKTIAAMEESVAASIEEILGGK